ncbi:MAG: hypothetical protein WCI04_05160 [archaeon]
MSESDKSVIKIIQKMVQDNEPEEKIISNLEILGVSTEQAKRLVLIAQADTFTLLASEIDSIVQEKITLQKEQMQKDSAEFINNVLDLKKKDIKIEMEKEFLKYKTDLYDNQKKFQIGINDTISKIAKLNEQSHVMAEENKKLIEIMNKDLSETKLKGIKLRRSFARTLMMIFGIILFLATIAILATSLLGEFNVDYITAGVVFALVGAAFIYLSANI